MPTTIDLANLGSAGATIFGQEVNDYSGRAVSSAGDVNGDGFDDLIIGAPGAYGLSYERRHAGESYVIFGGPTLPPNLDLSAPGAIGITIFGVDSYDRSGGAVASAGDVNGDGFDDLLIGAEYADGEDNSRSKAGETYIVFGGPALPATIDLADLGAAGMVLFGADANDSSGKFISGAGDVNGDGFDDLLIGARYAAGPQNAKPNSGETYLIFGGASLPQSINLGNIGTAGVTLFGIDSYDFSGSSVAGLGDVNGDGFDDVIIAAFGADGVDNLQNLAGEAYVIFGGTLPSTIDLGAVSAIGFTIIGADEEDYAGTVSDAGDVNGDGFDDILIGSRDADGVGNAISRSGESYIIFGGYNFSQTIDLANLGAAGTTIFGIDPLDLSGESLSSAGDVNGDGFGDLLISARNSSGINNDTPVAGETYVIFGRATLPATIDLGNLAPEEITIFGADANDYSGLSVSNAGDVNGDGFDDWIIGAHLADGPGNTTSGAGESYLIFGGNFTNSVTHLGTSASQTLTGDGTADVMNGRGGNDILIGNRGDDILLGGSGNDILSVGDQGFRYIAGGNGTDTLRLDGLGFQLDLAFIPNNRLTGIEIIDIRGIGANSLSLNFFEVMSLTSNSNPAHTSNTLTILRDGDDTVNIGPQWTLSGSEVIGTDAFDIFTHGAATLKVMKAVPVFTSSSSPSTAENETAVITVTATDLDEPAQTVTYSISGGADQGKFSLTSDGILTFIAAPDFEQPTDAGQNNVYVVQVAANDGDGGVTFQDITVSVTPVNESNPVFTSPAAFQRSENVSNVGTVVATDADLPAQTIVYSITGGLDDSQFDISSNGVLTFLVPPDFDNPTDSNTDNIYEIEVTADDGQGRTTTQSITVEVTPFNDVPVITSPATFSVEENVQIVGTLTATDPDLPPQTITFSITGGVDAARFSIAGDSLTFNAAPDFENPDDAGTDNIYNVQITANDGHGGLTVQDITVSVTAMNDNGPVFASPFVFNVLENSASVGNVVATDADLPAQSVTYAISGGADAAKFLVTSDGVLTFAAAPDFEAPTDVGSDNTYAVQVTADDGNGNTTTQGISVIVDDLDETPLLDLGGSAVTWIKKQPPVTVLPQITVRDAAAIGTRTLTISVDAIGTAKKLLDQFRIPSFAGLGTSSGPQFANGRITLQIQVNPNTTSSAIQSFLRGITFATKGKGLKTSTRTMTVTLADSGGLSGTVQQTVNVRKKA